MGSMPQNVYNLPNNSSGHAAAIREQVGPSSYDTARTRGTADGNTWTTMLSGPSFPGRVWSGRRLGLGRLSGLTFAVKDLFDVAGSVTTYGNPDWARTPSGRHRDRAGRHRSVAGGRPAGRQDQDRGAGLRTDRREHLARHPHQPARTGPVSRRVELRLCRGGRRGPGRFRAWLRYRRIGAHSGQLLWPVRHPPQLRRGQPGRRVPAGAQLRHRRLVQPAAASLLAGVGEVLLPGGRQAVDGPLLRVEEAWVNAQPEVAEALRPALERLEQLRGRAVGVRLAPEGIDSFFDHFRTVQAEEAWASLGGWIEAVEAAAGPGRRGNASPPPRQPTRLSPARPRLPPCAPGARPAAARRRRGTGLSDQPVSGAAADRHARPSRSRPRRQPSA